MKERMKEILKETVAFYGEDPSRRAAINHIEGAKHGCYYVTPDGRRCAIGRYLAKDLPGDINICGYVEDLFKTHPELIPEKLKGINVKFLRHLQDLHDHTPFWNPAGGLTVEGMMFESQIITDYDL